MNNVGGDRAGVESAHEGGVTAASEAAPQASWQLPIYMIGQSSWFLSLGVQFVLFPYLVAIRLDQSATHVGIAQASLMMPSLLFMLLGGATAEQSDARRLLTFVHALAVIPPVILATAILMGALSYPLMIAYALAMGTLAAFAIPTRDAGLTRVAGSDIPKAVSLAMIVQFSSQLGGMTIAIAARYITEPPILYLQAVILALGGLACWRLMPMPPHAAPSGDSALKRIRDGLATARATAPLLPTISLMFAVGVFYVGTFMVVVPLMVRDIYDGREAELALVNIAFWGGTIVASVVLMRLAQALRRRGRAMLLSLASGAVVMSTFTFDLSFWAFCGLCFIWGCGAGTTMTMSRTIVQTMAPESHRARILALYQLGFSGGAPVGAFVMGLTVSFIGLQNAVLVPAICMIVILTTMTLRSDLWRFETPATAQPQAGRA